MRIEVVCPSQSAWGRFRLALKILMCKNVYMHAQLSIVIETQSSGEFHRENEKCEMGRGESFYGKMVSLYNSPFRRIL